MKKRRIPFDVIIPLTIMILLATFFLIMTDGNFITGYNISAMLDTVLSIILGAVGLLFVISQGSLDISQGMVVLLAGTVIVLMGSGTPVWMLIMTALLIGLAVGVLNGVIVAVFKVSSLMATLATQIMIKGFVLGALNSSALIAPDSIIQLGAMPVKLPIVIIAVLIGYYLFTYTRYGIYGCAVGENEVVVRYSGMDVSAIKIFGFAMSCMFAGLAAVVTVATTGGVSAQLGNSYSIETLIAVFVGGVPVEGGNGSKMVKVIIGAMTITILQNGLTLMGVKSDIFQAIEGGVLLIMVLLSMYLNKQTSKETISDNGEEEIQNNGMDVA